MRTAQGATSLRVAGTVDFAYRTDIPLTVDTNMSKVVIFETCFMVARMIAREWSVNGYTMDSPCSINL